MKKFAILLIVISLSLVSFTSSAFHAPSRKASDIYLPIGKDMQISLQDLSEIKVKDYEKLTGKHMSFVERIGFKASQKKLRNTINEDGSINNGKFRKFAEGGSGGFNLGGFALGFFLGLLGVLLAYVAFNDDKKHDRIKWSWIGVGVALVLYLSVFLLI